MPNTRNSIILLIMFVGLCGVARGECPAIIGPPVRAILGSSGGTCGVGTGPAVPIQEFVHQTQTQATSEQEPPRQTFGHCLAEARGDLVAIGLCTALFKPESATDSESVPTPSVPDGDPVTWDDLVSDGFFDPMPTE